MSHNYIIIYVFERDVKRKNVALPAVLFEKVKSALVWILLILNTMINSLDFTNSKDCFYSYGLY